jgi:hypothetical protein
MQFHSQAEPAYKASQVCKEHKAYKVVKALQVLAPKERRAYKVAKASQVLAPKELQVRKDSQAHKDWDCKVYREQLALLHKG